MNKMFIIASLLFDSFSLSFFILLMNSSALINKSKGIPILTNDSIQRYNSLPKISSFKINSS